MVGQGVGQLGEAEPDGGPGFEPLGFAQDGEQAGDLLGGDGHAGEPPVGLPDLVEGVHGVPKEQAPLAAEQLHVEVVLLDQVGEARPGAGQAVEDLDLEVAVDLRGEHVGVAAHRGRRGAYRIGTPGQPARPEGASYRILRSPPDRARMGAKPPPRAAGGATR